MVILKKILKSTWIYFVLPLFITVIGGLILTRIENINFLSAIFKFLKLIFGFFIKILTLKISLWIIILLIIVLLIIIFIINKIVTKTDKKELMIKKIHEEYTEDYYNGLKYRWNWYKSFDGIQIGDIYPICECGCTFSYDIFDFELECPDCKKKYKNNVDTDSAERVFINRYNKKIKQQNQEIKKGK